MSSGTAYMFACFGEAFHHKQQSFAGRERTLRRALRVKKQRVLTGAFACFTAGLHLHAHGSPAAPPTRRATLVPSRTAQDPSLQLRRERHRRELCSTKLQEIERELNEFSQAFGTKLQELKRSMGEFAQSMKELMHYDEGTYIEDRLWEEADANSNLKAVDTVASSRSPPDR